MRMNRMAALTLSAGLFTMAACSDAPTAAPSAAALVPKTTSFAVNDVTASVTPVVGKIFVCKTGNAGGASSFALGLHSMAHRFWQNDAKFD